MLPPANGDCDPDDRGDCWWNVAVVGDGRPRPRLAAGDTPLPLPYSYSDDARPPAGDVAPRGVVAPERSAPDVAFAPAAADVALASRDGLAR